MENLKLCYNRFGHPCDVLEVKKENIGKLKHNDVLVEMIEAPVNPSDFIPITGAYKHRIELPKVAGYEGVGKVISASKGKESLICKRVLPLRENGTWQKFIKCDAKWLIEVPGHIENSVAARAYINPLTAMLMLKKWPVKDKTIIVTAAGSFFSNLMIQWAFKAGAKNISGIYRNPEHTSRILDLGVKPISLTSEKELAEETHKADIIFDAVGGALADTILRNSDHKKTFVSYGLLSGKSFSYMDTKARIERFHLRDYLSEMSVQEWNQYFSEIWDLLKNTSIPDVEYFKFKDWRKAVERFETSGRGKKPVLLF